MSDRAAARGGIMAGFLKSLFRGNPAKAGPKPKDISEMSVAELVVTVQSRTEPMTTDLVLPVMKRFYHIALFENHIPDTDRNKAITLAEAIQKDLEAALINNPDAISAIRTYVDRLRELAKQGGYRSLVWQINEYSISAAETVIFIMNLEHRDLVPNCLTTISPGTLASIKVHLIRELVLQSNYETRNAVLVLHGVAAAGDKAAMALLSANEYQALLSVPDDYYGGRRVLEEMDLLQRTTRTSDVRPASEIEKVLQSVLLLVVERTHLTESDPRINVLSEDKKVDLLLTMLLLRLDLFRSTFRQIYGKDAEYDIATLLNDLAGLQYWHRFSKAADAVKNIGRGIPVDFALLDWVMTSGDVEANTEAEFNNNGSFYQMAVLWLNTERVEFLQALRQILPIEPDREDWIEVRP
jgi:hypothetical protein